MAPPVQTVGGKQVSASLWQQGVAEALGAFLFTFISCVAVSSSGNVESEAMNSARVVSLSLLDGFAFFVLVNLTMRLTNGFGGYFNPALTLALGLLDSRFDHRFLQHIWRFVFFLVAQLVGALGGAFLVLLAAPHALSGVEKTGVSKPVGYGSAVQTTDVQAFFLEALLGLFLTMVVLAVRRHEKRRSSLVLALSYAAARVLSLTVTGGYVNPARSFASAVVGGGLEYLWIYVTAAPAGAILAVSFFLILHSPDMSVDDAFQNVDADDDEY